MLAPRNGMATVWVVVRPGQTAGFKCGDDFTVVEVDVGGEAEAAGVQAVSSTAIMRLVSLNEGNFPEGTNWKHVVSVALHNSRSGEENRFTFAKCGCRRTGNCTFCRDVAKLSATKLLLGLAATDPPPQARARGLAASPAGATARWYSPVEVKQLVPSAAELLEPVETSYPLHCREPANEILVHRIEEMEKFERAFNGEDRRWRRGPSSAGGGTGGSAPPAKASGSYVNARALALRKAAARLRSHPLRIRHSEQATQLPHVGESLGKHIREILCNGTCNKLERLRNDETIFSEQTGKVRTHDTLGHVLQGAQSISRLLSIVGVSDPPHIIHTPIPYHAGGLVTWVPLWRAPWCR
jgi:hypothetical protein